MVVDMVSDNYAIYGQPERLIEFLSVDDFEYADAFDPAGISTWVTAVGGMGSFREKARKAIEFHGTRDPVCHTIEVLALQHPLT